MDNDIGNLRTKNNDFIQLCIHDAQFINKVKEKLEWYWNDLVLWFLENFTLQNDDSFLKSLNFTLTNIQGINSLRKYIT